MHSKREKLHHVQKLNSKCKLFPYIREDCVSIQEATQQAGWDITAFNLQETWKTTKGAGVVVASLDTGCQMDHPDLVGNLLPGINLITPDKPPEDDNGHGCHVAGIIAALDNDIGCVGVAPLAKVMPVKVLDKHGNGSFDVVADGIRWAVDHGADIITMSLGSPNPMQKIRKACQYAEKHGIPVFCAAGNAGKTKDVFFPSAYPETIAIGGIDESFKRASYSNTGPNLDFMAPGTSIISTVPPSWYATMTGTSMACPWAAGVAALILSHSRQIGKPLKTVDDYRNALRKHTIHITDEMLEDKSFYEGFGIIDPKSIIND